MRIINKEPSIYPEALPPKSDFYILVANTVQLIFHACFPEKNKMKRHKVSFKI